MALYWVEYVGDSQFFDGGIKIMLEISAQHVEADSEKEAIERVIKLVKNWVKLVPLDFSADEESEGLLDGEDLAAINGAMQHAVDEDEEDEFFDDLGEDLDALNEELDEEGHFDAKEDLT